MGSYIFDKLQYFLFRYNRIVQFVTRQTVINNFHVQLSIVFNIFFWQFVNVGSFCLLLPNAVQFDSWQFELWHAHA